eukprot:TRINITY_DN4999_c0_g1_i1.p1 TRINITY_DN4999_c0_g1~~TRINITY_DN4999_c0_g1_i1.p1  ORF type:complete len:130 (-),score=4.23 TRINITY_DN4999_c0_g1_i1:406-795(-)
MSSAAAKASATPLSSSKEGLSTTSTIFISLAALITLFAVILATIYFAGYADDVAEWWAKRYYKAKALAEIKVMQNVGGEKVEGMLKDSLKKNPVLGEDELEQVSGGLGKEAMSEGFGGVSDKLGGLGKL